MLDYIVKNVTPEGYVTLVERVGSKEHNIFIEIYDAENSNKRLNLVKEDVISIEQEVLNPSNESYSNPICFECVNENNVDLKDKNKFAILQDSEKKILLKRIYG
ncbi:MAG: hypothetical protein IJW32_01200 [Clostridia bacterium]|nr:hypothetical protein [Clostridia bacterium]